MIMRSFLIALLAAGLLAGPASAQQDDVRSRSSRDDGVQRPPTRSGPPGSIIDATMLDELVTVARGYGSAQKDRTRSGMPMITGRMEGLKYGVYFYGCQNGANCKNIQFAASFSGIRGMTVDKINEWNRKYRFGKAYLDTDGDPVITMNVNLFGGVTRRNADDTWDWWKTVVKSFSEFIGYRR